MIIGAILLLAAAPAHVEPAACAALHKQFESNERAMAESRALWDKFIALNGNYQATGSPLAYQQYRDGVRSRSESERQHMEQGDRITTLLIANKCRPPDHVTSWTTYAAEAVAITR